MNTNSSNEINDDETLDLIPCEICNELIPFNEYQNHIEECDIPNLLPLPIFPINNNTSNTNIGINPLNILYPFNYLHRLNQSNLNVEQNNGNVSLIPNNNENNGNNNIENNNQLLDNDIDSDSDSDSDSDDDSGDNNDIDDFNNLDHNNILNILNTNNSNILNFGGSSEINNLINLLRVNVNNNRRIIQNINLFNNDEYESLNNLSERIGDVKIGVKNIDDIIIKKSSNNNSECLICREENNEIYKLNKCNHEYCIKCINKWFSENKKCPICQFEYE